VQLTQARLVRPLVVPLFLGIVGGGGGWLLAEFGGRNLVSGLAGGACSVLVFIAGLAVLRASLLRETFHFALKSMRGAASRSPASV
jgi:hypothetical protein